jgi:Mg2+/Co2+ transporter CorC
VHGEDRDEILGILLAKDLLRGVVPTTARRDRARCCVPPC